MSSTTTTATTKQVFRVVINAPIEKVWATLTEKDKVLPFFFNSVLNTTTLAPGAPIRMRSPNGKYTAVVGEVLEFDPPRRFSHTFKFTNLDDQPCVVIYELKSIEGGTEFTLTSDRVPTGTKTEKYMAGGGKFITNVLKAYVESGRPSLMARFVACMNFLMAPFTPSKCRSENWPLDKKV
jgi:uncharacterized protein YndB with AHSA1/START domain